jgi:peptide/nickel transport system substrate-binding protein
MVRIKVSGYVGRIVILLSLIGVSGEWVFQPRLAQAAEEYEHLRIGLTRDIANLDPLGYPSLDRPELNVQQCLFDHLLRRNEEGKIIGNLASDYKWLNEKTMRINLRKGITFHNGEKFSAADVKWSLEEMLHSKRSPGLIGAVKGIEKVLAVDDYTVDIHTTEPIPTLPAKLTCFTLMVSSKQRAGVDPSVYVNNPIGTGPFKLVEWKKGDRIVLERNEKYWRGMPKIKRLTFFPLPHVSTRVSALKSGTVDIAVDVPPSLAKELKGMPDLEVTAAPSVRVNWVYLRSDTPPFKDKRVRQAMNYAINKEEYIATVLEGYGLVIGQAVPPYFFGYNPDRKPYPYDPQKAKQLLAEAGYPNGFSVIFGSNSVLEERARPIAGYLKTVGIDCKMEIKEQSAHYADLLERKLRPMAYWAWGNWSLLDIDGTLYDCFGCEGKWSYFCHPRIQELIKELRTIDPQKRQKAAMEAERIIHEEAPMIFLFAQYDIHGKRKGIPEFKAREDNTIWLNWVKGEK